MKRVFILLMLVLAASAATLELTEPSGTYSHGSITATALFVAGDVVNFELHKEGMLIEANDAESITTVYQTTFQVTQQGNYTVKAHASYNGTDYEETTSFEVSSSAILVTIHSPENKTYDGRITLEVEPTMDDSFLHDADVTVKINSDTYSLPEGQNSYRSEAELEPGEYTAVITVTKAGGTGTASVQFTVSGETTEGNDTVYVPGAQPLELTRTSPTRAEYSLGEKTQLSVYITDNQNLRITNATITALLKTPSGLEQSILLTEEMVAGKSIYSADYIFSESGFYEVMFTAEKNGYLTAEEYMPPIKVGDEEVSLPEDVYCQQGICVRVDSPKEIDTYPDGSTVGLEIQVIEETTATPVSDAEVTASWDGTNASLEYDWNGKYVSETESLQKGVYTLMFTVEKSGVVITKNVSMHVSPDQLVITPINPVPGSNQTENFLTIQMMVGDQNSEVVTNANVRAIVTTPFTGTHTVPLSRNAATGYYESEYTFSDAGQHTVRVIASRIGYVSTESVYTFEVIIEQEGIQFTEQDIVIAALLIGVLIIIATLWKAIL